MFDYMPLNSSIQTDLLLLGLSKLLTWYLTQGYCINSVLMDPCFIELRISYVFDTLLLAIPH